MPELTCTELVWGWGAFVFGLVGMLLATATLILGAVAFYYASQEYKAWKKKEAEKQFKIDCLRQDLIEYAKLPLGETSFSEHARKVGNLLRLDLLAENPYKSSKDDLATSMWWAMFNMLRPIVISQIIEEEITKAKKPDDE